MTKQKYLSEEHSFDKKWSSPIREHGFTSIPNLLIRHSKSLGITSPEFRMIVAIEMHRWEDKEPYPSVAKLASLVGTTPRRARAIISSLHAKGLILRTVRDYETNTYSYEQLIYKLDQLATSSLPPGRKEPPHRDETRLERRLETSSKEDAANKHSTLKPTINTGVENVGEMLKRRYLQ